MAEAAELNETDNILNDVRAAMTEVDAGAPPEVVEREAPPEPPPAETAQQKADRERDEGGRFKAKDKTEAPQRETLKVKDPALQAAGEREIKANGEIKDPATLAPPLEWKGASKIDWNKLPEPVRLEIKERMSAVEAERAAMAPLQNALAPHKDVWIRDAGSVEKAIEVLGGFYNEFLTRPVDLIQHIARVRGIDLGQLVGQPQQGSQQQQPDINSFVAQAVQQAIAPIQERFQQTENQQITDTLTAFASDSKHPYYQDVRVDMGYRLQSGAAKSLDEAYEQAIWANSAIRPQLLATQAEEATKARAAEVAKARTAQAASLRGSPFPGATGAPSQGGTVQDDVRAAMAEIAGA